MKRGVSASEVARHLDVSPQRVGNMVNDGILKRASSGRFDLDACRIAYIRWLRAAPKRNSQSANSSRALELKIQALEMKLAREEGQLIALSEVEETVEDILGVYRSEMTGVPSSCTRDIQLRQMIEEKMNDAFDRCRKRFEQARANLYQGDTVLMEDEEAAA
jgi:phage terminase Nu1 subunit (DNA packaging protein)